MEESKTTLYFVDEHNILHLLKFIIKEDNIKTQLDLTSSVKLI